MSDQGLGKVFELPFFQLAYHNKDLCIGVWDTKEYFSTQLFCEKIDHLALDLINRGVQKGDLIGIAFSQSTAWWNIIDFAIQKVGAISIALHTYYGDKELEVIFGQIELFACFIDLDDFAKKVKFRNNQTLIFSPDQEGGFQTLVTNGIQNKHATILLEKRIKEIRPDDIAIILFTSGTLGIPKGVMLSHKNILSNIKSLSEIIPLHSEHTVVSFLPLNHIFERVAVYFYLYKGAAVHYIVNRNSLFEGIKEISPHFFSSVPRVLENALSQIRINFRGNSFASKAILDHAFLLGKSFGGKKWYHFGYWFQLKILDAVVFKHWRRALGGNILGIVVGGSAMAKRLGNILAAAKIHVREGYGLSETSPSLTFNRFEKGGNKFGTAGKPIPGVEIKINNKENSIGEILVKGPNVMKGYYGDPILTEEVFTHDGYFKTGDLGFFDKDGFLVISGRKTQIYKTSSGKFVNAYLLEAKLGSLDVVDQCLIVGFQKPFVSALIIPNMDILKKWSADKNVHWTTPKYMVHNIAVNDYIQLELEKVNLELQAYERIRKFILISEPWTFENGMLSTTLKIKRKKVFSHYQKQIEKLYRPN